MVALSTLIENHYHTPGLYEDILKRLEEQEIELSNVSRGDIAGVDEFHVRGAEVSKELANRIKLDNLSVLDVGCGIGGPSRMLADEYNCRVTSISELPGDYLSWSGSRTKRITYGAMRWICLLRTAPLMWSGPSMFK